MLFTFLGKEKEKTRRKRKKNEKEDRARVRPCVELSCVDSYHFSFIWTVGLFRSVDPIRCIFSLFPCFQCKDYSAYPHFPYRENGMVILFRILDLLKHIVTHSMSLYFWLIRAIASSFVHQQYFRSRSFVLSCHFPDMVHVNQRIELTKSATHTCV